MPRRKGRRCSRQGVRPTIDMVVEKNLIYGCCFDVVDWQLDAGRMRLAWKSHGEAVLARYIASFPGSRPMSQYLLGAIDPPNHKHKHAALRRSLAIDGLIELADRSWHQCQEEFNHLDALGMLDKEERARALERLCPSGKPAISAFGGASRGRGDSLRCRRRGHRRRSVPRLPDGRRGSGVHPVACPV